MSVSRSSQHAQPASGPSGPPSAPSQPQPPTQKRNNRKRKASDIAPSPAGTSVATLPSASTLPPTPGSPPGSQPDQQVVQPPPSLPASRPLPTRAPPKRKRKPRIAPSNPDAWAPVDIVERMFARFAESRNGITLGTKTCYTFAEATHPSVPLWPAQLFADFVTYYADNARPRRKGAVRVDSKALLHFYQTVRRCYTRQHRKALTKEAARAATVARHDADKLAVPREPRPVLTMGECFRLANTIWTPAYEATFRRRLDVALYLSLVLATGVPSNSLFPQSVPGKGCPDGPVRGLPDAIDGARWSDFTIWMTRYGPAAHFTARAEEDRKYTMNDGNTLGMASSRLMAITMMFDALCGRGCSLEYLLSERFWSVDGHDARIIAIDEDRAELHVFRLDDENQTPMMKEDMNFELARLAEAAGIEHEVTTGMLRRLVAHKVFEQHGLEIASAILNHSELSKTQRYIEKKFGRPVTQAEQELGRGLDAVHRELWLAMDHQLRVKALQKHPDCELDSTRLQLTPDITPHTWEWEDTRSPSPALREIGETDFAPRPGSPPTPSPLTGQARQCLAATPSANKLPSNPPGCTFEQDAFPSHLLSPLYSAASGSTASGASTQPNVAVHHQSLFGQPVTQVAPQGSVSEHLAMFGQLPDIRDISSFTPDLSSWPAAPQMPVRPLVPQQPQFPFSPQGNQVLPQQPQFHRTTHHPVGLTLYPPNPQADPFHMLPTPEETPPDLFSQLPNVGLDMQRINSAPLPQVDAVGSDAQQTTAFDAGLGLFIDFSGAQTGHAGQSSQSGRSSQCQCSRQNKNATAQPAAPKTLKPRPQPKLATLAPRVPPSAQEQQQPKQQQLHQQPKPKSSEEQLLEEVARWMRRPALELASGAGLVDPMIACDKQLPKNPRYDPSQYDEEDVDTDEE